MVSKRNEKTFLMRIKILLACLVSSLLGFGQGTSVNEGHAYKFNLDNFPGVYGGKVEWKRFLHDHLVYPAEELKEKTEGTVLIDFVVTAEGKSINPKINESVTPAIDNEALRLLSLIEWFPSSQEGIKVNVNHSVEISFSVSKYKKCVKERGFEKRMFTDMPSDSSLVVYETSDKAATFFDREKTFPEFIYTNLEYPEEAKKQGVEGKINMTFIIEPNGCISNIRIKDDGVGVGCNEEAVRVIGLTKWQPGVKNNKYVRCRMTYTMVFSLKNTFKDNSGASQRTWGQ
jgi:protein TonB